MGDLACPKWGCEGWKIINSSSSRKETILSEETSLLFLLKAPISLEDPIALEKKLKTQWNDGVDFSLGGCKLMAVLLFFTILSSHQEKTLKGAGREKSKAKKNWKRKTREKLELFMEFVTVWTENALCAII